MSWARAIMSISKKVWTFPARLYYYILLFPKINRKLHNSNTEGRKGHNGPQDNLEGKSCLAGSFLVPAAPNRFWCVSDVEDRLWTLTGIWAFMPIDSDIWLLLTNICLGHCTGHPQRGFMTDLSFGVWVCILFVWNENWLFPVLWPLLIFPNLLAYWELQEQSEKVHIYNGMLLSPKKEYIGLSSKKVDEIRGYYTEWSKSEREKQISYIDTCIWSLERWYWWMHLQGSNGDTDPQNRLVDTEKEGEGGTNWESGIDTYTLPHAKLDSQWKFAVWCRELKPRAL